MFVQFNFCLWFLFHSRLENDQQIRGDKARRFVVVRLNRLHRLSSILGWSPLKNTFSDYKSRRYINLLLYKKKTKYLVLKQIFTNTRILLIEESHHTYKDEAFSSQKLDININSVAQLRPSMTYSKTIVKKGLSHLQFPPSFHHVLNYHHQNFPTQSERSYRSVSVPHILCHEAQLFERQDVYNQ